MQHFLTDVLSGWRRRNYNTEDQGHLVYFNPRGKAVPESQHTFISTITCQCCTDKAIEVFLPRLPSLGQKSSPLSVIQRLSTSKSLTTKQSTLTPVTQSKEKINEGQCVPKGSGDPIIVYNRLISLSHEGKMSTCESSSNTTVAAKSSSEEDVASLGVGGGGSSPPHQGNGSNARAKSPILYP